MTTSPALQQTRRQLDDLDGLIQRMLAMPMTHLDHAEARALPEARRMLPEEFAPLPFPNRLITEAQYTAVEGDARTDGPVRSWRVEFGPPIRQLSIPLPGEPAEEPMPPYAVPHIADVVRPTLPEVSAVPPRIRERSAFRNFLGMCGLAMIAVAAGWAYLDWTEYRWSTPTVSPMIKPFK